MASQDNSVVGKWSPLKNGKENEEKRGIDSGINCQRMKAIVGMSIPGSAAKRTMLTAGVGTQGLCNQI